MQRLFTSRILWALIIWLILITSTLTLRPLLPIDETRYVSVAWEMQLHDDLLVPLVNGAPYSDKPPLFFWLIILGWKLFGINGVTPRVTAPLFGLLSLFLAVRFFRRLWPEKRQNADLVFMLLLTTLLWGTFAFSVMFDVILAFWVLIAMLGIFSAYQKNSIRSWILVGAAVGGGILTKGPVVFIHVLPVALLGPWWIGTKGKQSWIRWYLGILTAVIIGAAIALAWAVPAGIAGGKAYRYAIFMNQSSGRLLRAFAHGRPLWWYLPLLPAILFPWIFWTALWRKVPNLEADTGTRFCLAWFVPVLIIFSLVSGKQLHYLLPILPAFALLAVRSMIDFDVHRPLRKEQWALALVYIVLGAVVMFLPHLSTRFHCPNCSVIPKSPGIIISLIGIWFLIWRPHKMDAAAKGIAASMAVFLLILLFGLRTFWPAYDMAKIGARIKIYQEKGTKVAHFGKYNDQYHFVGRLNKPLIVIYSRKDLKAWINENPDGIVIYYHPLASKLTEKGIEYTQSYMKGKVALWNARALGESGLIK